MFGLYVFALWSLGIFAWLGFPGMARAEDLAKVAASQMQQSSDMKVIRVELLSNTIFGLRRDQCEAVKEGRGAGAYTQRLQEKLNDYFSIVGHEYILPACNEM